ncbi:MAG TPA: DNA repair protein RecN [Edaphocola sp.]|nr:DNA repair protein RecN [Edaphocola sp.]
MLQKLYIRNYVIIDELNIHFDPKLNVLTGETGAGKSIIVGALSLILGDRADSSVLINKEQKCIVEATFQIENKKNIISALNEEGLDFEEETIIRREISANGKSRAFVNDTPVNLATLNKVTDLLVDLHRQFDQYLMRHGHFVYNLLDAVANNQTVIKSYQAAYQDYRSLSQKYSEALVAKDIWQKEADYKQFLFEELKEADFQPNELEEAEEKLQKLSHAEQILQALQAVYHNLEADEPALNSELRRLTQQLNNIAHVFPMAEKMADRMESARIELKDIAEECANQGQTLEINPRDLIQLQERLDLGYRLLKKHQVSTTRELLDIAEKLSLELTQQESADQSLERLAKEKHKAFEEVKKWASSLHQNRTKQAPLFSKNIIRLLHLIGLPNAQMHISVDLSDNYGEQGNSIVQFLWDANKNGNFQPIQKSASGGEMSRIMLCIKSLTAEAIDLPTLIFDEVDTGISGEASRQVGILLQQISRKHQVICITHQPQVAGRGDSHFLVYKVEGNRQVKTNIRTLSREERVLAIARMIGGEQPSEAALENAKELVVSRN